MANFQYEIPVLEAVKKSTLANGILGGWQIGGIYTRQSGSHFSVKDGGDQAGTGSSVANTGSGGQRPMYVAAAGCTPGAAPGDIYALYVNTSCIGFPAPGVMGNLGRNTYSMPVFRNFDFSVFKNQNLWGEKLKAQFRVEMFNVFNNTNFQAQLLTAFSGTGLLNSGLNSPGGSAVSSNGPVTVNTSRQIQFGLRLLF